MYFSTSVYPVKDRHETSKFLLGPKKRSSFTAEVLFGKNMRKNRRIAVLQNNNIALMKNPTLK
jgi:hypothetical protein